MVGLDFDIPLALLRRVRNNWWRGRQQRLCLAKLCL